MNNIFCTKLIIFLVMIAINRFNVVSSASAAAATAMTAIKQQQSSTDAILTASLSRTGMFSRMPWFRNLLRVLRPTAHVGRKSDFRSDLDENYVNYHGSQLWKILLASHRKRREILQTEALQSFIEKYEGYQSIYYLHDTHTRPYTTSRTEIPLLLLRSIPGGLPTVWISGNELYENAVENIQFIVPMDIRRFNVFSSQSTYQINRNYRSDASVVRYHGYQVWKIHETDVKNALLLQFWRLFGNEVWNINQDGIDILIDYKNTAKAKQFINQTDFTYNIMIDDIETAIDDTYKEVNNTDLKLPWMERETTTINWNRYHDVADIQQFLQHILESYADMAEIIQIGLTHNKRPIEILRFSNGNANNWAIFVDAGLQGRDWLSPAALTYAISKLTWLWQTDEGNLMRNIDWYFLPVSNPDGYQYSRITDRLWTKNRRFDTKSGCYGVNLDRNFEYQWSGSGSSESPCKNLYHGPKEFSEPETRAIRSFLLNMKDYMGAYISFSGYGQAITYPWGDADYVTDNQRDLHKIGRRAMMNFRKLNQAEYRIGSSYRLKLARSGNSADWVQHQINPQYVYNVFLKDQGRYGYLMPPNYIVESGEEAYEFLKTIAAALN